MVKWNADDLNWYLRVSLGRNPENQIRSMIYPDISGWLKHTDKNMFYSAFCSDIYMDYFSTIH